MKQWCVWLLLSVAAFSGEFERVMDTAKQNEKLVLLFVESPSCPYCLKMKKEMFQGTFQKFLGAFYEKVVILGEEALDLGIKTKYFPTSYILDPKSNTLVDELPGYMKPQDFIDFLKEVYAQERGS